MTYIHVNVHDLRIVSDADYKKNMIEFMRDYWNDDMDEGCDSDFVMIDEKYRPIVEDIRSAAGTINDLRAALPEGEF